MDILIIGGGGRCHALVETARKSPLVNKIYCAPGNDGMTNAIQVPIKDDDISALRRFAMELNIGLTIVGPEVPLAMGIVDEFEKVGLNIFGANKAAARIESSKEFAKDLMKKYHIPTADYETFEDFDKAVEYINKVGAPIVIKFDGLAYGKGVVIAETKTEAIETIEDMLVKKVFGDGKIVVEEFLTGPEFSLMCLVDGETVIALDIAQDHKREGDGDTGANTGGMGAYSGVPFITKDDVNYAMEHIMKPVAAAMIEEKSRFSGVLYGGLMKTPNGIKVIEFNARFGDPETEVVLPRMKSDLIQTILDLKNGLSPEVEFSDEVALGVVLATVGYPRHYEKGYVIEGLENVNVPVFHMGTKLVDWKYTTNGGRVLLVLGMGKTFVEAKEQAYREIAKIHCDGLYCRSDIGYQVINFKGE
ncbi:MAG: phosphoribosylamine--glycine ligase [Clostridia bacterium]